MPPAGPPLAWFLDGTVLTMLADNDATVLLASQFAKLPLSLEVAQAVLSYNTLGSMNKTHASNDEALKQHRCAIQYVELSPDRVTSPSAVSCLYL